MTRRERQSRERGSTDREKQEKESRGQTEEEQGVVGLKYPGVGGRRAQQRGSPFTDQHT